MSDMTDAEFVREAVPLIADASIKWVAGDYCCELVREERGCPDWWSVHISLTDSGKIIECGTRDRHEVACLMAEHLRQRLEAAGYYLVPRLIGEAVLYTPYANFEMPHWNKKKTGGWVLANHTQGAPDYLPYRRALLEAAKAMEKSDG